MNETGSYIPYNIPKSIEPAQRDAAGDSLTKIQTPEDLVLPNGTAHSVTVEKGIAQSPGKAKLEATGMAELPAFAESIHTASNTMSSNWTCTLADPKTHISLASLFERVVGSDVTDNVSSATLAQQLNEKHAKGRVAIHMTPAPTALYDRFDDKRILNNLREDVGTDERREGYVLYQTLSTTLLPKATDAVKQQLYTVTGTKFVAIDVENTRVKAVSGTDTQAKYGVKNSSGRPSYRPTGQVRDIKEFSYDQTMRYIDAMNSKWTQGATTPKTSRLLGTIEPNFTRGLNETLLKVNSNSLLTIGTLASELKQNPSILLELIQQQKETFDQLGVVYPISIYNNDNEPVLLDMLGMTPVEIGPNQFQQLDVVACLQQLKKAHPEGVPIREGLFLNLANKDLFGKVPYDIFYTQMGYTLNAQGEPNIPTERQMRAEANTIRADLKVQIESVLQLLDSTLPRFTNHDAVEVMNREDRVSASLGDKYREIDQANLKQFIKDKVLKFLPERELTPSDQEKIDVLAKAYNLQYRLHIYAEIAEIPDAILNRATLKEDLHWAEKLRGPLKNALQA